MDTRALASPLALRAPLVALMAAVAAAGAWGLTIDRGAADPAPAAAPAAPARVAEAVAIPGGQLRVERVGDATLDHSMPMSGPSMPMSMPMGEGVKTVPDGFRRVSVQVTVYADAAGGVPVRPASFTVAGARMKPTAPLIVQFATARVPGGETATGTMSFDVPQAARRLVLRVAGAERAIALGKVAGGKAGGAGAGAGHSGH